MTGTKTACEESGMRDVHGGHGWQGGLSCITLAADCVGREITTIEGLADGEQLHPVQQAFIDHGAVQCGFCIPGMIMSAKALLDKNPEPIQEEIEYGLDGNLCRCGCYLKIFDAIRDAGQKMKALKN